MDLLICGGSIHHDRDEYCLEKKKYAMYATKRTEYKPGEEKRLVKVVKDIDNNVVVGSGVKVRTREFSVNENNLLRNPEGGTGTIGNLPVEEQIRILRSNHGYNHQE